MDNVFQTSIPYDVLSPKPLPGIAPLGDEAWLRFDEAFAGQMAERDRLVRDQPEKVLALDEMAEPAAQELLDLVLAYAYDGADEQVTRRDGVVINIDRSNPMGTLARLVQNDFCILQRPEGADEHLLTGAALCFPASWTLSQKFMRPMVRIHEPVDDYHEGIAKRVQRLLDGVQVGRPLWRFNALWYVDSILHQPRLEGGTRPKPKEGAPRYMRSERQILMRLPQTKAVVFLIHTFILKERDLAV